MGSVAGRGGSACSFSRLTCYDIMIASVSGGSDRKIEEEDQMIDSMGSDVETHVGLGNGRRCSPVRKSYLIGFSIQYMYVHTIDDTSTFSI